MNVLLDSDGVLANFVDGALKAHGRLEDGHDSITKWNMHELWGITEEQFWEPLKGREFWYGLKPYPWAKEMLQRIKDFGVDVTIATSPSNDTYCAGAKLEWLYDNLGVKGKDVMIGSKKWLMSGNSILIDDSESNCDKFIKAKVNGCCGNAILFPQPWNRGIGTWEDVIDNLSMWIK